MKISVCVPATRSTVSDTIASIRSQDWIDWELLLITQSADAEMLALVEAAVAADHRIRHVPLRERGASIARNAGFRESSFDIIAMIDDDAEARADWLRTIAECFESDPELCLVGGAVFAPPPGHPMHTRGGNCPVNVPPEVRYVPRPGERAPEGWDWISCNFAIRREVLDMVGGFDEQLGPGSRYPSNEDTDYKHRVEALGVPMLATPRAVVFHTYGVRKGLRARLRHQRNYSFSAGAMAAKWTLRDDPRGAAWLRETRSACLIGWLWSGRIHRAPSEWRRLWYFVQGYRSCMTANIVDPRTNLLTPRGVVTSDDSNRSDARNGRRPLARR